MAQAAILEGRHRSQVTVAKDLVKILTSRIVWHVALEARRTRTEVLVMIGYVCTLRIRGSVKSTEGEELAPPKSARASST